MTEGQDKGAGLGLLAVPAMTEAFVFTQAQFQRILPHYLGFEGTIVLPHTYHCGGGVTYVLMQGTEVSPVLERKSAAAYDAVCDVIYRMALQNGVTDATVTLLWWRLDSQQETEEPMTRTWSTWIPLPGQGST